MFKRSITSERGITRTRKKKKKKKKKKLVSYFSMRNPSMRFQDPSMHGSKVTGGLKSVTYACTNERTNIQTSQAVCPTNPFQSWGHKHFQTLQRAVIPLTFMGIPAKVNQVIYPYSQICVPNIKALDQIDILLTRFQGKNCKKK